MLEIRGIWKTFGSNEVLKNVSFFLEPGTTTAFLGRNGSGKTTTIRIMTGLLAPNRGEVLLSGENVTRTKDRRKVGYVADNPFLYSHLTGEEYLDFTSAIRGVSWRAPRMQQLVERFEFGPHLRQLAGSYSLGTRRKLTILAALVEEPKLLIMDEPTIGLDPVAVMALKDVVKHLTQQGSAVFMSTHLLASAQEVCSRALVLHQGIIAADIQLAGAACVPGHLESLFIDATQGVGA